MAKNVELNYYNGSNYEVLYPSINPIYNVMTTILSYIGDGTNNTIFLTLNLNPSLYMPFMFVRSGLFMGQRICILASSPFTSSQGLEAGFIKTSGQDNSGNFSVYYEMISMRSVNNSYNIQILPVDFIYNSKGTTETDASRIWVHGSYSGQSYEIIVFYTNK